MTRRRPLWTALVLLLVHCLCNNTSAWSLKSTNIAQSISTGYQQRVAADPTFPQKSVTEILLAAGTQMTAEWNRRGTSGLKSEIDFVVAGVLTAIYGKFYSMWRVAPTRLSSSTSQTKGDSSTDAKVFGISVPTNAFQPTLLDGTTVPTFQQRLLSLVSPVPALFQAGCIASIVGYGLTALFVALRSLFMPNYVAATRNVNILYASLYTGAFMAIVSNLRYQVLQGILEPFLDSHLKEYPALHAATVFAVRLANGLLGSTLAIIGMKAFGVQQLKS